MIINQNKGSQWTREVRCVSQFNEKKSATAAPHRFSTKLGKKFGERVLQIICGDLRQHTMSPVFVKTQHSHRNYKKFVGNCLHTTVQAKKLCSPQRAAQKPTKHVLFAESTVTEMAHIHVLQNLPIAQVTMTQRLTQFRQYGAPPCFLRNIHNSRNDHYPWERDRPWRPCSMASEITRPLDFTC